MYNRGSFAGNRKNPADWYDKAEKRCAFYTKYAIFGFICIYVSALFVFAFMYAIYNILVGNLDTSTYLNIYKVV